MHLNTVVKTPVFIQDYIKYIDECQRKRQTLKMSVSFIMSNNFSVVCPKKNETFQLPTEINERMMSENQADNYVDDNQSTDFHEEILEESEPMIPEPFFENNRKVKYMDDENPFRTAKELADNNNSEQVYPLQRPAIQHTFTRTITEVKFEKIIGKCFKILFIGGGFLRILGTKSLLVSVRY